MTTVEYDLDTSGGLMPQIQALIAPPASEESGKKLKKEREHRYRRPGRTVNHDCCDSCKEGGDLICCDRCPATFHLQCHDPPLSEDDLPSGEWICHRCKVLPDHILSYSSMENDSKEKSSNQDEGGGGKGTIRKDQVDINESNSRKKTRFENLFPSSPMDDIDEDSQNPLQLLIRAAACMNPKQFQLPNEMSCTLQLPGSNKRPKPKDSNKNNNKKPAYELDNGIVPLPAKLCFQCRKSCRKAPLVQCDYCPLLFHADCLDPPLTSLPATRWMCPNHPEHILEEKLLTTVSLTERVKLWDRFAGHLSQDAVKVAFFNKVHRVNPPFRCKRKAPGKPTVRVPEAIKEQYKHPPILLPRVHDLQNQIALNFQVGAGSCGASQEEQENWLSSVVSFQTSIAKYMAQQQLKRTIDTSEDTKLCPDIKTTSPLDSKPFLLNGVPNESKIELLNGPLEETTSDNNKSGSTSDTIKTKMEICELSVKSHNALGTPQKINNNSALVHTLRGSVTPVQRTVSGGNSNGTAAINSLSSSTSVLLPRPQQQTLNTQAISHQKAITTPNSKVVPAQVKLSTPSQKSISINNLSSSPAILNLNSTLQSSIEGAEEVELSKLDERLISILAWQRLQQLLPPKTPPLKKGINGVLPSGSNDVKARAIVCPLSGKGPSISMPYRTLTIGTGADMDVSLTLYGQCNYVSSKHASIFYDEITKHYELLNYSEHGTTVDNVLYSCDFSEKHVQPPPPNSIISSVRKLTEKTRNRNEEIERATMSGRAGEVTRPCNCKTSSSTLIGGSGAGWEGTALLHHGSYIKCGCLQFVFSITDYSITKMENTQTQ